MNRFSRAMEPVTGTSRAPSRKRMSKIDCSNIVAGEFPFCRTQSPFNEVWTTGIPILVEED